MLPEFKVAGSGFFFGKRTPISFQGFSGLPSILAVALKDWIDYIKFLFIHRED